MRPDKEKVIDEIWDDERIRGFLDKQAMGDEPDIDYSALLYAYRSMRPGDFGRFLAFFVADGRNVNACSKNGMTLLQSIATHRPAEPFRIELRKHGAQA